MRRRTLLAGAIALLTLATTAGAAALSTRRAAPPCAPPLDVEALDGRRISLADLRGRPVVVEFFGAWCPECRRDVPFLNQLAARGVTVLAVCGEARREDAEQFVRETGARYPVALADAATVGRYGVTTVPTRFLVGPDGELLARDADLARIAREVGR